MISSHWQAQGLDYASDHAGRVPLVHLKDKARGTPVQFLRAYLMRHEASWPDP